MRLELTFFTHGARKPRIERYGDGWNHAYFVIGYLAWKRAWKPPKRGPLDRGPRTTDSRDWNP